MSERTWRGLRWAAVTAAVLAGACHSTASPTTIRPLGDGLDVYALPVDIQGDYMVFARRCSKCHSLSRPLDNGHVDDAFWERYVDRMRHQPASGIAPEDVPPILHFLHYYSSQIKAQSSEDGGAQ